MTALSDYNPATHDPKPILLVSPWRSKKRAMRYITKHGGSYASGSFDEIHNTRTDHVVIEDGHRVQEHFEDMLMYTMIDECYDCYDEIHMQWGGIQ